MAVKSKEIRFPVQVEWRRDRTVAVQVPGKPELEIAPPPEFWPEADPRVWSPEDAFGAAAASCLAVTILGRAEREQLPLLGLLVEGDGTAAHVLDDLGASLEKVRGEIDRLHHEMPPESEAGEPGSSRESVRGAFGPRSHTVTSTFSKPVPVGGPGRSGPGNPDAIWRAAELLAAQQHTVVGVEHLLLAAVDADPLVGRMLAVLGIDDAKLAEVRRIATPPAPLLEMRRAYEAKVGDQRAGAVETEEYQRLRDELNDAERRWRDGEELTGGESEAG